MEILFSLLFELAGNLLQFVLEFVLQIVLELLGDTIVRGVARLRPKETARAPWGMPAWVAGLGYLGFGALAGWGSVQLFPHPFISEPWMRIANLMITPIVAGAVMALIGALRARRGKLTTRFDQFAYAWFFATGLAAARLALTR